MKKIISLIIFLISFVITYLIICFAVPGMRIKLEAEPMEYFFRSIKHMAVFKTIISLVIALILSIISFAFRKK